MKKILIVSPIECYPNYYGNSARVASFVSFFQQSGIDFRYLHLPDRHFDPQPMIDALGSRYIFHPYRPRKQVLHRLRYRGLLSLLSLQKNRYIKVDDFVQSNDLAIYKKVMTDYQPDTVWINYTYLSKLLTITPPSIQKIIDTHDSLFLRYKSLYNGPSMLSRFRIKLQDEIQALNRADKVIGIQEMETQFFQTNGCTAKLYTIGYQIPYQPMPMSSNRTTLLYIGALYDANSDAISDFVENIWPFLITKLPSLKLFIAGGISDIFGENKLGGKGIQVLGRVDNLQALYSEIDIAINPVRLGSGLKIKNIEALSYGRPVLTTPVGAQGLSDFIGKGLEIARTKQEWLAHIENFLYQDSYYRQTLRSAEKTIRQYNDTNLLQTQKLCRDEQD